MRFFRLALFIVWMIFAANGCKYIFQSPPANINHAPSPAPTPSREYNEKRLPIMRFQSWHRSKPGMILTGDFNKTFYLAAPEQKPASFSEYKVELYGGRKNPARSNSGKYEVTIRKFNERVESSGCCAVQRFDYETILSEVDAPENRTKLADTNWEIKSWSPDDKFMLFSWGQELFLIEVETKEKTVIFPDRTARQFVFDHDSKGLFVMSFGKEWRLEYFDIASKQLTDLFLSFHNGSEMRLSPDGKTLAFFAVVSSGTTTVTADNRLYLFDVQSKAQTKSTDLPKGEIYPPQDETWRADSRALSFDVGGENYTRDVYSFEIESGKLIRWYPPTGETTGLYKE